MTIRKFTYRDLLAARRAAEAWSVSYGDCERVRRATTVKTITAAHSVAQGWSNFNGKCKIIEGRKPARGRRSL